MGSSHSYPALTEDVLEDYSVLTYLSKAEILYLMKKYSSIDPDKLSENINHRFDRKQIVKKFDILRENPFQDRLFKVFSSKQDDCFSFEDLLDLCSVMSSDCPIDVKATWAFRVFDIDEDNQISARDICEILERLTMTKSEAYNLDEPSKMKIANIILEELKLDTTGSIGLNEFKMIMTRLPDFHSAFYFRL